MVDKDNFGLTNDGRKDLSGSGLTGFVFLLQTEETGCKNSLGTEPKLTYLEFNKTFHALKASPSFTNAVYEQKENSW